ncbi:DNA replication and repair protein RecR [Metamycoplasma subdolum]|uniref:Recombination protein RecR n=1 Tax=Metamycoplasma subdolum TaxID=92407 RepID=A0A3M0A1W4_9BACT|nr:toprim domain-containing protein [Metamycoplasma subdolum]RMA78626.1 DNA replication and repair protein RecR [Metamycoplasma subdolum]WPB50772.1 toprim domain-containing protein [Metamycoplasma subdolum]
MNFVEIEILEKKLKEITKLSLKQVKKIAFNLLNLSENEIFNLNQAISKARENIKKCKYCNSYTDKETCEICSDKKRSKKYLVVEKYDEVSKFEEIGIWNGRYFVLEGLLDTKTSQEIVNQNIINFVALAENVDEVVLALSSTLQGQLTMQQIKKLLLDKNKFKNVFTLSTGIPLAAEIEYIDPVTLKESLINKVKI